MTAMPVDLALAGAGKMGGAMLAGWQALGLQGRGVSVLDPQPAAEIAALCERGGFALNPALGAIAPPQALVLAVKPQMLDAAAPALEPLAGPDTLLISIIAGKTVADLQARFPRARADSRSAWSQWSGAWESRPTASVFSAVKCSPTQSKE